MRRRNRLLGVLLIILLGLTVGLILYQNSQKVCCIDQTPVVRPQMNVEVSSALATSRTNYVPAPHEASQVSCPKLKHVEHYLQRLQVSFVQAKAIGWYFDGTDKTQIASTLASIYGYNRAIEWVEQVNSLSRYHELHHELIRQLNALEYNTKREPGKMYLHNLASYRVTTYTPDFDVHSQLNLYPDIEQALWQGEFEQALQKSDVQRAMFAISRLKELIDNPMFFPHPLRNLNNMLLIGALPPVQSGQLLAALFELAPLYVVGEVSVSPIEQSLKGLVADKSAREVTRVYKTQFKPNAQIQARIENIKAQYFEKSDIPQMSDYCDDTLIDDSLLIKKVKSSEVDTKLPSNWLAISRYLCPERDYMFSLNALNSAMSRYGVELNSLESYDSIWHQKEALAKLLPHLDEYESTMLYELVFSRIKPSVEQIHELQTHGLIPENSDFYSLIYHLPHEKKKQLLSKYLYQLKNTNAMGFSLIAQVMDKSLRSDVYDDETIPFLMSQGLALKGRDTDIDPLWFALFVISNYRQGDAIPINTLNSLIENTQLSDLHSNMLFTIKRNDRVLYDKLIKQLPALTLPKPSQLIEIECLR